MPLSGPANFTLTVLYSGLIAGLCDGICQGFEMQVKKKAVAEEDRSEEDLQDAMSAVSSMQAVHEEQKYNWPRTLRYIVCPGFMAGFAAYIEIILVLGQSTKNDWGTVIWKTLFDLICYYPILIAGGFTTNMLLDCKDWHYIKAKFKNDFLHTWKAAAIMWLPVDIILFKWVPVQWQVYVVKTMDIIALLGFSYFLNKHPLTELHFGHGDDTHRKKDVDLQSEESNDKAE